MPPQVLLLCKLWVARKDVFNPSRILVAFSTCFACCSTYQFLPYSSSRQLSDYLVDSAGCVLWCRLSLRAPIRDSDARVHVSSSSMWDTMFSRFLLFLILFGSYAPTTASSLLQNPARIRTKQRSCKIA